MFAYIMLGLVIIVSIIRFYKNRVRLRTLFKTLSKKEWLQYITVFLFAWAVTFTIIIGGAKLTNTLDLGWISTILGIVIILIALSIASFIFEKLVPEKVKAFYNWKNLEFIANIKTMQQGFYGALKEKSAPNFSILRKLFRFNATLVVLNLSLIIENKIYAYISISIYLKSQFTMHVEAQKRDFTAPRSFFCAILRKTFLFCAV